MQGAVMTIFRSRLRPEHAGEYAEAAEEMDSLVRAQPGFVDAKTFTAADGERVTVVTFAGQESHDAWRHHPEHRATQRLGIERFYSEYSIQVGPVSYRRDFTHTPG
jgi:heme-degrading monooxygenase HmoA